ncbi:MAG: DUF1998 domain-containing protein, partial [Chloroflexi bacterium]|nr:DUF1998 domain-containing protein [Chloroflexota bacterium]
ARSFALWNPPFADGAHSVRRAATSEAAVLLANLVRHGLRNITFARTRRGAELILNSAREQLMQSAPQLADKLRAYRAGYLADERRSIEAALFSGKLLGVAATNALELGVDIGELDATVLVGYPGTVASVWQQAGRAGRDTKATLSILIAEDNPLDQFFVTHPEALFRAPVEHALIQPDNPHVLAKQLPCAAFELPLTSADEELFGDGFVDAMIALERAGVLEYVNERWHYRGQTRYPAQEISLRSASSRSVKLVHERNPRQLIEELDASTATLRAHAGAIYLSQGETFLVTRLDLRAGVAYARRTDVDYYTEPRQVSSVHVVRAHRSRRVGSARAYFGSVRVSERVVGYRRKRYQHDDVLVDVDVDYPPQSFETRALWWEMPISVQRALERARAHPFGSVHAVEHLCAALLPLFAMCDHSDIGALSALKHEDTGGASVFIFDAHEGGVGISEKGYTLLDSLWRAALDRVSTCACANGCPSCVQSPQCSSNNEPLDKHGATVLLAALLAR